MKGIVIKTLKTILPLGLGCYLIWYFFTNMDEKGKEYFYQAIDKADYSWIFLSVCMSFIAFAVRAYRWKYMLEPIGYKTTFWNRYHSLMIGYIINLTIPRAGEASRSAMLYKTEGVPFSKSFGTIIGERAVDLIMLLLLAGITAVLGYDDFNAIFLEIKTKFNAATSPSSTSSFNLKYIIYSVVLTLIIISTILLKFKPQLRKKIFQFIKDIFIGLFSIFKTKNPITYIAQTLLIWVLYITYFGVCFFALKETENFPLSGILLGFLAGSLGIMFTNGGIGTFPLLIGLVVNFILGKENPNALAIGNALGMIIWVSQTLLLIVLGLLSFIFIPNNFNKDKNDSI